MSSLVERLVVFQFNILAQFILRGTLLCTKFQPIAAYFTQNWKCQPGGARGKDREWEPSKFHNNQFYSCILQKDGPINQHWHYDSHATSMARKLLESVIKQINILLTDTTVNFIVPSIY